MKYILSELTYRKIKTTKEKVAEIQEVLAGQYKAIVYVDSVKEKISNYECYNKANSKEINEIGEDLLDKLFNISCWAHHCILKGKKRDLIENINKVCDRTLQSIKENQEYIHKENIKNEKELLKIIEEYTGQEIEEYVVTKNEYADILRDTEDGSNDWKKLMNENPDLDW